MADHDWMAEALASDGRDPSSWSGPVTLADRVAGIVRDTSASVQDRSRRINALVRGDVDEAQYDFMMAGVEVDALRGHVYSPVVMEQREGAPSEQELETMADELQAQAEADFNAQRSALVDVVKDLHRDGRFGIETETWARMLSLDHDKSVSEAFAEDGGLIRLALGTRPRDARPERHAGRDEVSSSSGLRGVDVSKPVRDERPALDRTQTQLSQESELVGPDQQSVAAHIAEHRRQASQRPSSEPTKVGQAVADFMRRHGRNQDGSRIEDEKDYGPDL